MSLVQIIVLCILYCIINVTQMIHVVCFTMSFVIGFICGIVMGDWKTGLIIGAAIQTLNMAPVTTGAQQSYDLCTATFVAVPLAIVSNMTAEVALTLAIPFAVLAGSIYTPLERTLNSISANMGEKAAERGDARALNKAVNFWPLLYNTPARFIPMFLVLYFGSSFITPLISSIPDWLMNGLSVAGGILPAVGFALFLNIIGKRQLLVYFFLGFYISYSFGLSTIVMSIFGVILAILHNWFMPNSVEEGGI